MSALHRHWQWQCFPERELTWQAEWHPSWRRPPVRLRASLRWGRGRVCWDCWLLHSFCTYPRPEIISFLAQGQRRSCVITNGLNILWGRGGQWLSAFPTSYVASGSFAAARTLSCPPHVSTTEWVCYFTQHLSPPLPAILPRCLIMSAVQVSAQVHDCALKLAHPMQLPVYKLSSLPSWILLISNGIRLRRAGSHGFLSRQEWCMAPLTSPTIPSPPSVVHLRPTCTCWLSPVSENSSCSFSLVQNAAPFV